MSLFEGLVGRKLDRIYVSKGGGGKNVWGNAQDSMRIATENYPDVFVTTYADCCSETWFADVLGADAARGAMILEARNIEMEDLENDPRTRQEVDRQYGYELVTDRGVVSIVLRNSSNGYYGGDAEISREPITTEWEEITSNDWHS